MTRPRIAIAHDYITQRGGAERVVLALSRLYPDAPIYTTLYNPETTFPEFRNRTIITSPLNRIPLLRQHHRYALPFLAWASNRMKVDADLVVASTSGWAHGFPTTGLKLVYCHSPARWLYLSEDYLGAPAHRSAMGAALTVMKPLLKRWDRRAAATADLYVANANVIKKRIATVYDFDSVVVPPPFGVSAAGERSEIPQVAAWQAEGFYLVVSRLMPYKNVDAVIEAFRGREEKLLIVGSGPLAQQLRDSAPENVLILSGLTDTQLRWAYATSRGLVAPSYEDFGLTPLEGGSFGKPVAALHSGGYLDTVVDGLNGVFFEQPRAELISAALDELQAVEWDTEKIKAHAEQFSEPSFDRRIDDLVQELLREERAK